MLWRLYRAVTTLISATVHLTKWPRSSWRPWRAIASRSRPRLASRTAAARNVATSRAVAAYLRRRAAMRMRARMRTRTRMRMRMEDQDDDEDDEEEEEEEEEERFTGSACAMHTRVPRSACRVVRCTD